MNGNLPPGSQPVVKIDGEKIRHLREVQGLTQLYLATSVGVTTDTISRWENKRYPTIKKENALKLAEALEVSIDEIIDSEKSIEQAEPKIAPQPEAVPAPLSTPPPDRNLILKISLVTLVLLTVIAVVAFFFLSSKQEAVSISASRLLPPHTPQGHTFPVLIQIQNDSAKPLSIIVKELFPASCKVVAGIPAFTTKNNQKHLIKWINQASDGQTTLAYLLRVDQIADPEQNLAFSGEVTHGKGKGIANAIKGDHAVMIQEFHWADTNADNNIDDEEILAVYDAFGSIDGLAIDRDQIDAIWSSSGYHWDETTHTFIIRP